MDIEAYFQETIRILNNAIKSIDTNDMERLVVVCEAALKNGRKIIVSGLGKNVAVCEKFVGAMVSLGLDARFMNTNSAVHGDLGMVKSGDVVIVLSKSGETKETIYLTELLKNLECEIWLLTFNGDCELAKEIKNYLAVKLEHEGDPWNIMPNHSTILNLIVLQTLAMELAKCMEIKLNDFKRNHPGGAIGKQLKGIMNDDIE